LDSGYRIMMNKENHIITEDLATITSSPIVPWEDLAETTALVTGANGMLASYMIETILSLNNNARIIAAVRNPEKAWERFSNYPDNKNLTIVQQDLTKPIITSEPVDYIIHAASIATPVQYSLNPVDVVIPNTIGTYHCLNLAREQEDIKAMLFFSSGEVYGATKDNPITETSFGPLDPSNLQSCYAESKRMGETLCAAWGRQYKIPVKIVRPSHTYGPGMPLGDGRVFSDFVADVINKRDIRVTGNPDIKRTFCYLSDATIAFFLVMLQGMSREAYNVGGDGRFEISVLLLAQMLADKYGLDVVLDKHNDLTPYTSRVPDISKIRALGWEPKVSVPEGFSRTVESFAK
jgi:UDP-glucuronate decarboxylase